MQDATFLQCQLEKDLLYSTPFINPLVCLSIPLMYYRQVLHTVLDILDTTCHQIID